MSLSRVLVLSLCALGTGFSQPSGLDAPVAIGPYLNGTLPAEAPGSSNGWNTVNAFPNLSFVDPLWLTPVPLSGDLLLVGKNGRLWRFPNQPAATQGQVVQVLDWAGQTQTSEDQGFYSLAFHPGFGVEGSPDKDHAYVCYSRRANLQGEGPSRSYWRVSRFTWDRVTGTLLPGSEQVLIQQFDPDLWHNGGAMFFDAAGYLNITCGDGGDSPDGGGLPDSLARTQRLDAGLFSGVFRIDVNSVPVDSHPIRRQPAGPLPPAGWPASFTQGYQIPNSNPWQDPGGAILEEYAVVGLRSPHTAHYDSLLDEIWIGDVGGALREELSRFKRGANGQWGYKEGSTGGAGAPAVPPIGRDTPPFLDYGRDVGSCIIGGMRYRGARWNMLLGGKVLLGDHIRGKIWAVDPELPGTPMPELVIDGFPTGNKTGLGNFCTDGAGEIYLMTVNGTNQAGGTIRKLVSSGTATEPPRYLSQTGAFSATGDLTPSPGVMPYDVANPLWSDGAAKKRWIALPNDGSHDTAAEKIAFSENGNWRFPAGTVFVKHFEIATNADDPAQVKRLETRLLVCTASGGKYGLTYKWNQAGTDAELLTSSEAELFQVVLHGGELTTRRWDYPSRADCLQCHTAQAGQALGFRTGQLNRRFHYDATGRTANQLATFNSLGMFDRVLTGEQIANFIESRAIDDISAPLEHRVRSYLDSNCAHCHQPGGTVPYFDARLGTPLDRQGLIHGDIAGHFPLPGGAYVKPGDTSLSAILIRQGNAGNGSAMPPLAKNLADDKATAVLARYVASVNESDFQHFGTAKARYIRLTGLSEVNGHEWSSAAEFSILDENGVPIPHGQLSISDFDSQEINGENARATMAIDGDPNTFWHTAWAVENVPRPPHYITIDMGQSRGISGYTYLPRQGSNSNGRIAGYQVDFSQDGIHWLRMDAGTWPNDEAAKSFTGMSGLRSPRCEIAGPGGILPAEFEVTIAFDSEVVGLMPGGLQVTGGSVSRLRGSGYYYVATVSRTLPLVSVQVPAGAANHALLGNLASNVLNLGSPEPEVLTPFAKWALMNDLGGIGAHADPDHNGVPALADYLFSLNPRSGQLPVFLGTHASGLPKVERVNGRLRVDFPRNMSAVAAGYRYVAQFSSDMRTWQDVEAGSLVPMSGDWWHMTIDDPQVTGGHRFGRVKLVKP